MGLLRFFFWPLYVSAGTSARKAWRLRLTAKDGRTLSLIQESWHIRICVSSSCILVWLFKHLGSI